MSTEPTTPSAAIASASFADLGLPEHLLKALASVGYESPSPIQAATIPPLVAGRDMLGQAQTGTGKTAAFALPILASIDLSQTRPQALVLAPTRELAIQVAEAFHKYAAHLPGFHVLPIYGGQGYGPQLAALKRGVHVVVGTPGRVIDHLTRGTLDLSQLKCLVLDEADEMLRMGFIDDVETVLKQTPEARQVALFSATMPTQIRRIAQTYLKNPVEIAIKSTTTTATNIRQRYWMVSGVNKLDALTRILEAETYDGMLVFARTKLGAQELAEKLAARGLSAAAIHGDVEQKQREKMVQSLKDGRIDILVATDVAARGLDVERISHVLNYDIPYDTESYVHRIGRTGRAGRSGEAIVFVAPRERGMLGAIERATRQKIEPMQLPSVDAVNDQRVARFLGRIAGAAESSDIGLYRELVERYEREHNVPVIEIAAALAKLVQGETPLLLPAAPERAAPARFDNQRPDGARPSRDDGYAPRSREPSARGDAPARRDLAARRQHDAGSRHADRQFTPPTVAADGPHAIAPARTDGVAAFADAPSPHPRRDSAPRPPAGAAELGMETFRIEVGHAHGVQPGNIVGAIANEAGLEGEYIGRIDIREDHTFIDLPQGMPKDVFQDLQKTWVCGQQLRISRAGDAPVELPYTAAKNAGKPAERPTLGFNKPQGKPPH
ncbi:MAG: DEAD/DEAH box helicase, partial [Luteimonas sp.]